MQIGVDIMEKNILDYINDKYKSFLLSDLIFRILGIFLYNYLIVFLVQVISPLGYGNLDYFSSDVFPYIVILTINSTILSISIIIMYKKHSKSSIILSRAITAGYISLSLLLPSLVTYNGLDIALQDPLFVFLKTLFYIITIFAYPLIIIKKILPKFTKDHNNDTLKNIWLAPSLVIVTKRILSCFEYVDVPAMLTSLYYMISMALLCYAIELFIKSYYAKQYSL